MAEDIAWQDADLDVREVVHGFIEYFVNHHFLDQPVENTSACSVVFARTVLRHSELEERNFMGYWETIYKNYKIKDDEEELIKLLTNSLAKEMFNSSRCPQSLSYLLHFAAIGTFKFLSQGDQDRAALIEDHVVDLIETHELITSKISASGGFSAVVRSCVNEDRDIENNEDEQEFKSPRDESLMSKESTDSNASEVVISSNVQQPVYSADCSNISSPDKKTMTLENVEKEKARPSSYSNSAHNSSMEYQEAGLSGYYNSANNSSTEYEEVIASGYCNSASISSMEYEVAGASGYYNSARNSSMEYEVAGPSGYCNSARNSSMSMEYEEVGPSGYCNTASNSSNESLL